LLSCNRLAIDRIFFNVITPPHLFWNRDRVNPFQFQFNYFFEELTLLGYAFLCLLYPFYREGYGASIPRIFKLQYGGG